MMIKIILIPVFLTAFAYAVSEENEDNVNDKGFTFPHLKFPQLPNFPNMANFPSIPRIPAMSNFANFQMPTFEFPEIKFPDITKNKDGNYYGVSVTQNSDGTTTIITNKKGVITRVTVPEEGKEEAIEKSKEDLQKPT